MLNMLKICTSAFAYMLISLLGSQSVVAAPVWFGGTFTGDIVMYNPEKPDQIAKGKLFVGQMKLRAEGTVGEQTRALIMDMEKGQVWTLDPDKKRYHDGPGRAPMPPMPDLTILPSDDDHPMCGKDKPAQCLLKGEVELDGVNAHLWEISMKQRGRVVLMQLWVDPKRRVVLKYAFDKGPTLHRKLVEVRHVQGRATEKWVFTEQMGRKKRVSEQWVDAKLYLPVRMVQNGQITAEIKNIKEMIPNANQFLLPEDYKRVVAKPKGRNPKQDKAMKFH
ncbi:hypothetical protein [Magnetococcus sp. PR-3]|uniref:hypothetical protein n=1 Tax=Magnetococcus sp. PR-3 TaxID=3120355 RepID=UPI002FCE23C1